MSLQISPSLEGNQNMSDRVRQANQSLEPLIRQHSQTATGSWDLREDERGRPLLTLAISDPWGYAAADFTPQELENPEHLHHRVYQLIGEMINPTRDRLQRERIWLRDSFVTTEQLETFRQRLGTLSNLQDAGIRLHNQVRFLSNRPNGFLLTDFALEVDRDRVAEVRQLIRDCGFRLREDAPLLEQPGVRNAVRRLVESHRNETQAVPRFAVCFRTQDRETIHLLEVADDVEELGDGSLEGVGFSAGGSVPGARTLVLYLTHPDDLHHTFREHPGHIFFRDLRSGLCEFIFPDDGGQAFRAEFPEIMESESALA